MPHVVVKLYAGRSKQEKTTIAEAVAKAVVAGARCAEASVSVSVENVASADWVKKVYEPEIIGKPDTLYVKPGYGPR